MDDLLTISSGALSARINPLGAELWSLTDRQGREYMTDADPAFWSGHAPLLFPVVGSLARDRLHLDGKEHTLLRHGFARRSLFAVIEQGESVVRFRLSDSAETRAAYPFAFALDMAFRLDGLTLAMEATVFNPGDVRCRSALAITRPLHGRFQQQRTKRRTSWSLPRPSRRMCGAWAKPMACCCPRASRRRCRAANCPYRKACSPPTR